MIEWIILALGFSLSLAIGGFMVRAGVGDVPDNRSSHSGVIPTSAGLGVIAAIGGMSFMFASLGVLNDQMAQILSLTWGVSILGLSDDLFDLGPIYKFLFLLLLSVGAVWVVGPVYSFPFGSYAYEVPLWAGWIGSVLWIFVVVNIVNFMDGANGLMLVVMAIASLALAMFARSLGAFYPFILLIMLVTGIMGILPYNFRNDARVFTGDVGSLTIGFVYAVAFLWFCRLAPEASPLYLGPVLILPFLADSLLTMWRRARYGENILTPHRSHLYQRLIKAGVSHLTVALFYGAMTIVMAIFTWGSLKMDLHRFINFLILPSLIIASIYLLASRKLSARD